MKKLVIQIKDGKIVGYSGTEVCSDWDSTHISGNGWYCTVSPNGTIQCVASEKYGDRRDLIKFVILPSRWAKISLRRGNHKPNLMTQFKFKNWPLNGTIELYDGKIEKRGAFLIEEK